ncbi:MAG TPA: hypothetical protein VI588_03915 [Candidatus Gracilibacteria bacterium]|nr:hypothetical protein [Candidatus Gracilibacteria bacterium]
MKTHIIDEIIGWYGAVAIVGAYALLSFGVFAADSLIYQLLNATGAVGVTYISYKKRAYQPAALNAIWTVIAAVAILQILT